MTPIVHQITIPNPFFEGQNRVYVIATDPVTLIDTGVATHQAYEVLQLGLAEHGLKVRDIRRVVLTHKHIDHLGNAWRVQEASGAEIWIHQSECDAVTHVDPKGLEFRDLILRRLAEWRAHIRLDAESFERVMPHWEIEPAEVQGLVDGQTLEFDHGQLEVIYTPGHTIGSICLRYGQQLFTGDHVLAELSPNIGGGDLKERGLLKKFINSLERIELIGDGLLANPGHGESFAHLVGRCEELICHHHDRLGQIEAALGDGPLTVFQLAVHLFGEMDDFHVMLGCAEAHAHLEWLVDERRVSFDQESATFAAVKV